MENGERRGACSVTGSTKKSATRFAAGSRGVGTAPMRNQTDTSAAKAHVSRLACVPPIGQPSASPLPVESIMWNLGGTNNRPAVLRVRGCHGRETSEKPQSVTPYRRLNPRRFGIRDSRWLRCRLSGVCLTDAMDRKYHVPALGAGTTTGSLETAELFLSKRAVPQGDLDGRVRTNE